MLEPTDPDYPHGTQHGYNGGCRKTSPCPAQPTCHEAKRERQQKYRADNPGRAAQHTDWPQTSHVQKRLAETVKAVGYAGIMEYTGVSRSFIKRVVAERKGRISPRRAEPLDHAWSYFTRGVDTLAPGFKHGRVTSYTRYACRCTKCRTAAMRGQAKSRAGHKTEHNIVAVPKLAVHVEALLRAGGPVQVANAAQVSPQCVHGARAGERVRISVARKLLACTSDDVARVIRRHPAKRTHQQLRSMWALGYPLSWLAAQEPDLSMRQLSWLHPDGHVHLPVSQAIDRLAARIGDTPATPEVGILARSIFQARTNARRLGFYPPACYDDNGDLITRAVPDHPWARADDDAAHKLTLAREVARPTDTRSAYGRAHATDVTAEAVERALARMADRLGVHVLFDPETFETTIRPGDEARTDALRTVLDAYEDEDHGPVWTALEIGLVRLSDVPADHPEVVEWTATLTRSAA